MIHNVSHAKIEAEGLEDLRLMKSSFKRHDPKGIVKYHYSKVRHRLYMHEIVPDDSLFQGVLTYDEVKKRIQKIKEIES